MKNDHLADVIDIAAARTDAEAAAKLANSLMRTSEGGVHATVTNALVVLAYDPNLRGLLGYNSFTLRQLIMRSPPVATEGAAPLIGPYPRAWDEEDVTLITSYIQRVYCAKMHNDTVRTAMATEAKMRQFHPVVDWLASLQWDGFNRLDTWLTTACGCPETAYHADVGAKTLIAAVRRVRSPGCKFDTMMVLEGLQDLGKSSLLRRLAGEDWFSDSMPANLESKDAAMALAGRWITEFAELQHVVRLEVETIKAFLSRSTDRYRPPYARHVVDLPRQGIIIGTTNESDYLRDTTGNRRFWPVRVAKVDLAWISENRDQLWAEAAAREAEGETIYLDDPASRTMAAAHQQERVEQDIWTAPVLTYTASKSRTTVAEVLSECLMIEKGKHDRRAQLRVGNLLRHAGWTMKIERGYDGVQSPMRVYYPPVVTGHGS